ncbi:winged helix-turn-helix transcriptional regulator [bacterium]|nr:winged helix-turn-helix transcriptional regulator [bacterium]
MTEIDNISDKLKAISDPTRLRIIQMLSHCRRKDCEPMLCVNALARRLEITQSAVSQHLKVLKHAGFVKSERRGYFIHYRLNPEQIDHVCSELDRIMKPK